ncbi:MAG: alpha/beta fold hydrolase [Sandaracinaceae bacterium]|nr:alpha/beta fold hydrolase [Sandaracinaceae bacterium]
MADEPSRFTETRAFATQAALIARNARRVEPPAAGRNVVVLVHGFLAAPPVFDPLRRRIAEDLGWASMAFGYASYGSFEATAERFSRAVEQHVPAASTLTLVGHSLGGLLARWYVEELGGAQRVERVVTVSTPHQGTRVARLAPFGLGASILPGSAVIERLAGRRPGPALHALAGADDGTVSQESALGCAADTKAVIEGVGHNAILYAPHAQDALIAAIAGGAVDLGDHRRSVGSLAS